MILIVIGTWRYSLQIWIYGGRLRVEEENIPILSWMAERDWTTWSGWTHMVLRSSSPFGRSRRRNAFVFRRVPHRSMNERNQSILYTNKIQEVECFQELSRRYYDEPHLCPEQWHLKTCVLLKTSSRRIEPGQGGELFKYWELSLHVRGGTKSNGSLFYYRFPRRRYGSSK